MATIGNRFGSLPLNAQDPLEKSKKKQKNKEVKLKTKKVKSPQKETEKNTAEVKNESLNKPQKSPRVIITDLKPKGESPKKLDAQNTEAKKPELKKTEIKNVEKQKVEKQKVEKISVTVRDARETQAENHNELENLDTFAHDYKDRQKNQYRKMMVSRGRVYDRHSARGVTHEKRHGHGAYNWGEATDLNESEIVENDPIREDKEEAVSVTYTLDQYNKLIEENKIDPLSWNKGPKETETVADVPENFRDYEYRRSETRGGRGRGGAGRRGRGGMTRGDHADRRQGSQRTYNEVKVDDLNDFPAL